VRLRDHLDQPFGGAGVEATLAYAAVDCKSRQRAAGPEEYAGFWLCDPQDASLRALALSLRC
jgi:hypothetical protein